MSLGKIIAFPERGTVERVEHIGIRSCDQCIHFMSGFLGQYCRAYEDDIFSVHEAVDCENYEPV